MIIPSGLRFAHANDAGEIRQTNLRFIAAPGRLWNTGGLGTGGALANTSRRQRGDAVDPLLVGHRLMAAANWR
jgi:hypothetical protein